MVLGAWLQTEQFLSRYLVELILFRKVFRWELYPDLSWARVTLAFLERELSVFVEEKIISFFRSILVP